MKMSLMDRLIELLNFWVSPMYKLAIRDCIQFDRDPALPPIPHEVDNVWIECVTTTNHSAIEPTMVPITIISLSPSLVFYRWMATGFDA
uniref:Uncharacterized protein n=1 Tax=Romanomermis culicivorax TaxID=13658 RepID=A0A915HXN5_ROMCU